MTIYRGFEIAQHGNEWFVTNERGDRVHVSATEDAAMNWIDAEKRRQRQAATGA